jgi:hypothetical protein
VSRYAPASIPARPRTSTAPAWNRIVRSSTARTTPSRAPRSPVSTSVGDGSGAAGRSGPSRATPAATSRSRRVGPPVTSAVSSPTPPTRSRGLRGDLQRRRRRQDHVDPVDGPEDERAVGERQLGGGVHPERVTEVEGDRGRGGRG